MNTDKLKKIDVKIAKLFESLEAEINKRAEITEEKHAGDFGYMVELIVKATHSFEKFKTK